MAKVGARTPTKGEGAGRGRPLPLRPRGPWSGPGRDPDRPRWGTQDGPSRSPPPDRDSGRWGGVSSKKQAFFNFMAAVTICSDFGNPKDKVSVGHLLRCGLQLVTTCLGLSFLVCERRVTQVAQTIGSSCGVSTGQYRPSPAHFLSVLPEDDACARAFWRRTRKFEIMGASPPCPAAPRNPPGFTQRALNLFSQ